MSFKEKYLRYKKKYIDLKNQLGHGAGASIMSEQLSQEYADEENENYEGDEVEASNASVLSSPLTSIASTSASASESASTS